MFVLAFHRNVVGMFIVVALMSTEGLRYRCQHSCEEAREVLNSSVIGVRAQLREYYDSRRTRRADDEHCLLLLWIGPEA